MSNYCVKSGDTLYAIAKLNNTTVDAIRRANANIKGDKIQKGQSIVIPPATPKVTVPAKTQKTVARKTKQQMYTIKSGNTFEGISNEKFIPLEDLRKANPNIDPNKLKVGQKITIPAKRALLSSVDSNDKNFNSILNKILRAEGGFKAAEKDGSDVRTNKGITQDVYNQYLKDKAFDQSQKNVPSKDVKNISDNEVKEIYYNYYYKKCGADKEKNPKTAHWLMDTAVNCGVGVARTMYKECGTDNKKWYAARKQHYESIIEKDSNKSKFLNGWLNRIKNII